MEQTNKLYEVIKPVRSLESPSSGRKKGLIILGTILIIFSCMGVVVNLDRLNIDLPFDISSFKINNNATQVYSWDNHSMINPILNTNLINPSFNAGGLKLGFN